MEYRQLKHFIALAEEQGFRRAATREQIVQSGLSHSIQALERSVGSDLYVRGSRPVRLTDTGEALLGPARRAVAAMEEAESALVEHQALTRGTLTVGVLQAAGYLIPLADALASFTTEYPGVDVSLRWDVPLAMLREVENGTLGCALAPVVPGYRGKVRRLPIAREPLHLALPLGHRLATAPQVRLEDLAGEVFVDVPESWTVRRFNDVAFERLGLERRVRCEVNDWHLLIELVAAGVGVGFAPAGLAGLDSAAGGVPEAVTMRAVEDHVPERAIGLALPRGEAASRAAIEFARHLRRAARRRDADTPTEATTP